MSNTYLHNAESKNISERRCLDRKRRIFWSMFFLMVGCILASPKTAYPQWTTNGSDINNTNTGNVGIGTTTPSSPLTVIAPSGNRNGIVLAGSGNTWVYTDFGMVPVGTIATGKPLNFIWSIRKDAYFGGDASGPNLVMQMDRQGGGLYAPLVFNPNGNVILAGAFNATNGNVGVGTVSPAYKLDVSGAVNATSGLCLSGDCKTAWSQVGGSQWTTSGSSVYYNSNVGIGITGAPARRLDVLGGNVFHQWSTTAGSEYGFYTAINNNHFTSNLYFDGQWKMITAGKGSYITAAPLGGFAFTVVADNTSRAANAAATLTQLLAVTMGGNVGIGTGTPDSLAKLHLYGSGPLGQDIQTTTNDWTRLRFVTPSRTWGFFLDSGTGGIGAGKLGLHDYNAGAFRMVFDTAGNVGIGTTSPIYSLDVNGGVNGFRAKAASAAAGDTIATFENSSAIQMIVRANGNVGIGTTSPANKLHVAGSITVDGNINAKYQDVAEWVESSEELSPGTVVVLDDTTSNQVIASRESYDTRVAGVISASPGIALGEAGQGKVLVATTGRVKIKVSAKNGPIRTGDLLVTSDQPGVAARSQPIQVGGVLIHRPGTLIGKALEPLSKGEGEILVLLSLQ